MQRQAENWTLGKPIQQDSMKEYYASINRSGKMTYQTNVPVYTYLVQFPYLPFEKKNLVGSKGSD